MQYLGIILSSLFSLLALFIFTKINGNRQISELTIFDYIIGISIGSIAAEMATELEEPLKPLLAMGVYALVQLLISYVTTKSIVLRRIIFGRSVILIENGRLLKKNFAKGRMDINEFLVQCRCQGYFDISSIKTAILEQNGKLSILPFSKDRNVTIKDLNLTTDFEDIFYNVIMDGKILYKNLKFSGFDQEWLFSQLKANGYEDCSDIFLATLDSSGKLNVFEYTNKTIKGDVFE